MRKCILIIFIVFLLSFGAVSAEIDPTRQYFSTNIDDCYTANSNGWINGMKATYEISVKDASLFSAEYFMTYAFYNEMKFVKRILDSENYTVDGSWAPYSVAKVFFDFSALAGLPSYGYNSIPVMIGAVIDPNKVSPEVMKNYEKGVAAEQKQPHSDHLLINEYAKQIPVDGLYFIIYFPDNYNYYDIQRYGSVLEYLTQFVLEVNESGIDFVELVKTYTINGQQHLHLTNTSQLTKDGYSIGVLGMEKFIFLAVTDANDYVFSDQNSVISFYQKYYEKPNMRMVAYQ